MAEKQPEPKPAEKGDPAAGEGKPGSPSNPKQGPAAPGSTPESEDK